jgi:hypothetical protein
VGELSIGHLSTIYEVGGLIPSTRQKISKSTNKAGILSWSYTDYVRSSFLSGSVVLRSGIIPVPGFSHLCDELLTSFLSEGEHSSQRPGLAVTPSVVGARDK